jgi:peptide deformylase
MTKKEFEKKYNLIAPSEDILRNKVDLFDFKNPPVDPEELGLDLLKHMRYFGGIGLSANQLGLPYRVFVMEGDPGFVCFNPRITAFAGEDVMLDEGCLSYPGLYIKKKRPNLIRVRFMDPFGNPCVKKFTGMTARIFQHEMEHMDGENFLADIGEFALRRAKEKQTKLLEKVRRQKNKILRAQKQKR